MLPLGEPLATDAMTQKQDKKLSPLRRVPLSVGAWGNSTAPAVKIRSYNVRTFASRPAIYVMSCFVFAPRRRNSGEVGDDTSSTPVALQPSERSSTQDRPIRAAHMTLKRDKSNRSWVTWRVGFSERRSHGRQRIVITKIRCLPSIEYSLAPA